jgi:SAM-dependent methyltransferase
VVGVDLDWAALIQARQQTNGAASLVQLDMRHLAALTGPFDAVICLWQSFGYFDPPSNADVLNQISRLLRPDGRFILDIYHRFFFETRQGQLVTQRAGQNVTITNTLEGDRLIAQLDYADGRELFNWQLFTPEELCALAASSGLRCRLACTLFDEAQAASPTQARMQLVFEKREELVP